MSECSLSENRGSGNCTMRGLGVTERERYILSISSNKVHISVPQSSFILFFILLLHDYIVLINRKEYLMFHHSMFLV